MDGLVKVEQSLDVIMALVKKIDTDNAELVKENKVLKERLEELANTIIEGKDLNLFPTYKDDDLLTIQETADLFKCGKGNIYRLHSIGELKGFKPGKIVRFKYKDLMDYLR